MDQLKRLFESLSWTQRIWLLIAAIAVGGGLTAFSHWNQERDFKPLYSNLAAEDAQALVTKLKESAIDYRLAESGSVILVSSERIAEARLAMAGAGLPKSGRIGFELFDKAQFGASDFAEQVNYHRAIEGELERSVMSISDVEQARVHLTLAKDSLYTESRQPAKASVLVKLRAGAKLSPQNIAAICQLTASAVPELSVDQVSLVDTNGMLLNRPKRGGTGDGTDGNEAALDYRKSIEKDIQNKIAATLDPLLGSDHFRAGVSASVDLNTTDQSEEVYDPQKSVLLTSQTTQDGPALASSAGVPGTPSNLPRPTSGAAASTTSVASASNYARKTENVSYQTSRLVKHTKIPQGAVTKLSVSVLIDHGLRWEGSKRVIEPPSPEKLKIIHDLLAAAVGLNADRGDQLVVEAFPFEATLAAELPVLRPAAPAAPASALPKWLQKLVATKNFVLIASIGAGAILLLIAGLVFVVIRKGKKNKIAVETGAAALADGKSKELAAGASDDQQRGIEAQMTELAAAQSRREAEELMKLKIPAGATKKTEVLSKHIAAEAKKDPALMAQVVRSWLHG